MGKTSLRGRLGKPVKTRSKLASKARGNGRVQTRTKSPPKSAPAKAARPKIKRKTGESSIVLPNGYRPSESEPFMNERHRVYFRNKLVAWKEEIVRQNRETLQVLHEDSAQHADLADRATSETDRALELRARDRQRKLIAKIDAALARIEDGTYGFCEETGEPIGLKRLDARPIATLSLEAQERHERREKVFRED
jgi:DnaK suppressor protein